MKPSLFYYLKISLKKQNKQKLALGNSLLISSTFHPTCCIWDDISKPFFIQSNNGIKWNQTSFKKKKQIRDQRKNSASFAKMPLFISPVFCHLPSQQSTEKKIRKATSRLRILGKDFLWMCDTIPKFHQMPFEVLVVWSTCLSAG